MKKPIDKSKQSLANLKKAYSRLEKFLLEPLQSDRDEAGVVQAFEFTFELIWKTLQKYLETQGLIAGSPRQTFEYAMKAGILNSKDELSWLKILEDRNLTVHTYDAELCHQIFERVRDQYKALFHEVIETLENK